MMLAIVESVGKKNSSSSSDKRLLHEIEAISQALYLNKNPSKGGSVSASDNSRSKSAGKGRYPDTKLKSRDVKEDKKPSIWNWKPLKALAHNRSRRFNCCFSLEVHAIEGLSLNFDDTSLCVHWKRRDESSQTRPSKVVLGVAKFEETLLHRCSITGSGNGPNHSAKYEAKHSVLYVSMVGYPALDLGKHQIDLTRLLPLNLEELEEEKSSGKWTTSYKLTGKAKGASLNVSFGFMIARDDPVESRGNRNPTPVALNFKQHRPSTTRTVKGFDIRDGEKLLVRTGSLPATPNERSLRSSQSVEDVKILHEVLPSSRPDLSTSVSLPCPESDEGKVTAALDDFKIELEVFSEQNDLVKHPLSQCMKGCSGDACEIPEFNVIERGIEMSEKEKVKLEEGSIDLDDGTGAISSEDHDNITIFLGKDMSHIPQSDDYASDKEEYFLDDISSKENNIVTKESMEELDSAFQSLSMFTSEGLESPEYKGDFLGDANYMEYKSTYRTSRSGKSLSFDDASDTRGQTRKKAKRGSSAHGCSNSTMSSLSRESGSEYVNLEDLAPLAMDKIEALSIDGLRIQSGISDEEAPSNISPQATGDISALAGKRANINGSLGLEGAGGLQLLDIIDGDSDVDGVMGLSITLDEWMKLDARMIHDEDDQISERASKILAAHHASSTELFNGGGRGDKKKGKGKKCGLLGNNFTVTLMVQLRDPLSNYEPVMTPMLALIQAERVFVPPKPRLYVTVSENPKNEDDDNETATVVEVLKDEKKEEKKEIEEEVIPELEITEVHVAGLKTDPGKKKLWGSKSQQQSGSRWLLASGMGKSNKNPLMKSKVVAKSSTTATVQPGDTLWSISSRVHGDGSKWKDLAKLNPHIRNPNVIFPNETIRLQ